MVERDYGTDAIGYGGSTIEPPTPRSYRIRTISFPNGRSTPSALKDSPSFPAYELGAVVTHSTTPAYDYYKRAWFHALNEVDQFFADKCSSLIQRACAWFYEPDGKYEPMEGVASIVVTDADVERRIAQIDHGENTREAERIGRKHYHISELPFDQQRALVEQLDALALEFGFEKIF